MTGCFFPFVNSTKYRDCYFLFNRQTSTSHSIYSLLL
nr:MAG TPA_asm: hypothetical protein [Caudoviricetes sp.]